MLNRYTTTKMFKEIKLKAKDEKYLECAMTDFHTRTNINPMNQIPKTSLAAPIVRIEDHKCEVLSCEFHPSGKYILSSNSSGDIHICGFDDTLTKMIQMRQHIGAAREAHFSKDGTTVFSCSDDKTISVWDPFSGYKTRTLKGHKNGVNGISSSRIEYPVLCSGSKDCTIRVWDIRVQSCAVTLKDAAEIITVCFNENGEYVFSGSVDKDIKIWDLRMMKIVSCLEGHLGAVTGLSLSPCGSSLLSVAIDNTLRIWDVRPYVSHQRCINSIKSNQVYVDGLMRCAWSPDGRLVSAGTSNRNVCIWDALCSEKIYELPGHESSVNDVAFHPTENILLAAANDNFLYMHELIK